MKVRSAAALLLLLAPAYADTLTLRNGTTVTGSWAGVDAGQVSFLVNDVVRTYPRAEVSLVTFTPQPAASAPTASQPLVPAPPPPAAAGPRTVSTGDTKEQVVAAYGQPERIGRAGGKEIYFYKDSKVIFIDGKVSDIQ